MIQLRSIINVADNRQYFGNFDGVIDVRRTRNVLPALLAVLFRSEADRGE